MRSINPKCTNNESFKYSVLISLYYYELNNHKERTNQLKPYINKYNFTSYNYIDFENNNPFISLTVYDEYGDILHKSINKTNNNAQIVMINKYIYHALKIHNKELTEYIMNKIIQ